MLDAGYWFLELVVRLGRFPATTASAGPPRLLAENGEEIAPGRSRTCDLGLRSPSLYPPELQARASYFTFKLRARLADFFYRHEKVS